MREQRLKQPMGAEPARNRASRPAVRTIADLIGMICGAADACDLDVTMINHRSIRLALPAGVVRIDLRYGPDIPLMDEDDAGDDDEAPSDQFPCLSVLDADDCGVVPTSVLAAGDREG